MPIDIDGFAVLGAIVARPDVFSSLKVDASKSARLLIIKKLKEKTLKIDDLVEIASAITHRHFDLVVDAMTDAEIKSLAAKFDKHNPLAKSETAQWRRTHVCSLAKGEVAPTDPPAKAVKAKSPTKPPVQRAISSKAMKAVKKPQGASKT